ncbi:U-box domain-containing protein 44-like, partial [Trifolium medium]|nr:U-box domain-containing protein 44-like [Trifolium medium]
LSSLVKVISEKIGITEEQAAAVGLLADLPERDLGLARQLLDEGAFRMAISKVIAIKQGEIRGTR